MCVRTNLLNRDTVSCSIFAKKSTQHRGLSLCSVDQKITCSVIDSMPTIAGGSINIRKCGDLTKCYDGSAELCKISTAAADRDKPSSDFRREIPDSQYYDPSASSDYENAPTGTAKIMIQIYLDCAIKPQLKWDYV